MSVDSGSKPLIACGPDNNYFTEMCSGSRNVQRFRGGLVCKAHRLLYLSTLGLRVIKKKKKLIPDRLIACGRTVAFV